MNKKDGVDETAPIHTTKGEDMQDILKAVLVQASADVMQVYRGIRQSLTEVNEEQRDVVAATLTHAVLTRMSQIAESME